MCVYKRIPPNLAPNQKESQGRDLKSLKPRGIRVSMFVLCVFNKCGYENAHAYERIPPKVLTSQFIFHAQHQNSIKPNSSS
jgi:hypothetical protein